MSFNQKLADKACNFFPLYLHHTKGRWDQQPFYLLPWQRDLISKLFGTVKKDGTRQYKWCYVEIPKKNGKSELAAGIALYLLFVDQEPGAEIYCLDPLTKILSADLSWKYIAELELDDKIISFDDKAPGNGRFRKLRIATITSNSRITQQCYHLIFEDGRSIICSAHHKWLARRWDKGEFKEWVSTADLKAGVSSVRDLGQPWPDDPTRDAGYLAGLFDGEGCFHRGKERSGFRIALAQRPGTILAQARQMLMQKRFNISAPRNHASGVDTFEIRGLYDCMRFLGQIRPMRLLEQAADWYEGKAPSRVNGYLRLTAKQLVGEREVIAIGTSTGTLFAEGLFSHNSAAADRDQAAIVFNVAADMVGYSEALSQRCKIVPSTKRIIHDKTRGVYRVLSADVHTKHGFNTQGVIFDELHAQPNRDLFDVLTKGSGDARRQPLFFFITTAGYDRNSICWEMHERARQVLNGSRPDPTFLPILYYAEEESDWTDQKVWESCNPSMTTLYDDGSGILDPGVIREQCQRAEDNPTEENLFRRLRLCQWVHQETRYIPMAAWDACGEELFAPETLAGKPCYGGLDLASSVDIAAFVLAFEEDGLVYLLPYFWVPGENIEKRARTDKVPYDVWVRQGFITATPGNVIDYAYIRHAINELSKTFEIKEVPYDRWGAVEMSQNLTEDGFQMVDFGQGYRSMSPPTKELLRLVLAGKLRHNNNPVLRWMADNVMVTTDPAENVKPDKSKSTERIDGIVAAIMAIDRLAHKEPPSVYTERGVLTVSPDEREEPEPEEQKEEEPQEQQDEIAEALKRRYHPAEE